MVARREEHDRNAPTGIMVVIASAVVVLGMPVRVVLIIERESMAALAIGGLHEVAQLGREPA